ncbi:hypothetical protein DHL47_05690 [Streptococcus panodentis]|uniref:Uncharacterized protein n=1 Tax=Streptococcus panodentis TaxID=1581472 RepID=A0ABS5AWF9_9STRE|nr:hypothetical protein [Streptococcus panodentis]
MKELQDRCQSSWLCQPAVLSELQDSESRESFTALQIFLRLAGKEPLSGNVIFLNKNSNC